MKTIFTSKWYVHSVLTVDRTPADYDQDIILVIFHLFWSAIWRNFSGKEILLGQREMEQDSQPYTLSLKTYFGWFQIWTARH